MLLSPVGDFAVACETITCIIIKSNLVYFFILPFFHELQEWGLYCHQVRVSLLCCGRKGQYQYKCWHRIFFLSVNQCNVHEKIKRPSYFHGFACSVYQVKCKKRSFLSVILSAIYQIWLPWYENFYQGFYIYVLYPHSPGIWYPPCTAKSKRDKQKWMQKSNILKAYYRVSAKLPSSTQSQTPQKNHQKNTNLALNIHSHSHY